MTDIPMIGTPEPQRLEIPRSSIITETCSNCGGPYFVPLTGIGRIPGLLVGKDGDAFTYIPTDKLMCAKCGVEFVPDPSVEARPKTLSETETAADKAPSEDTPNATVSELQAKGEAIVIPFKKPESEEPVH